MKVLFRFLIFLALLFVTLCTIFAFLFIYFWSSNLPFIGSLRYYHPPEVTEVFSDDGVLIGEFFKERRRVIQYRDIPEHVIMAFVAAEDANFFKHPGLDIKGIIRATIKNILAGRIEQGGSTITQQVAKSLLLKEQERTLKRKVREALLSLQLEKRFTKEEILYFYLNQIYFGEGAYGIEMAARTYFGKGARELTLAEAAILAGLPKAPSRYSPKSNFELARSRQQYVLKRMYEEGMIERETMEAALRADIQIKYFKQPSIAPYFLDHIRKILAQKYGQEAVLTEGYRVYTTLDTRLQAHAEAALIKGLKEVDKREGYRGPIQNIPKGAWQDYIRSSKERFLENPPAVGDVIQALVVDIRSDGTVLVKIGDKEGVFSIKDESWIQRRYVNPEAPSQIKRDGNPIKVGDIVEVRLISPPFPGRPWAVAIDQTPQVQGAIMCMEVETGYVRAMVGGYDYKTSQFNRVTQAKRQPGSAFKPIVYAAAMDYGMTPATVFVDEPFVAWSGGGKVWAPQNYGDKYVGPTSLRNALAKSINVVSVKVLKRIGVGRAVAYAKLMGIESELDPNLALALGASAVHPYEMVKAFSVFATNGDLVEPIYIKRILDREGDVLEEFEPRRKRVLSPETAYVLTDMMKAVVNEGTGWRVKALNRPVAGKTGTSNDLRDAWFIGYTPEYVVGVWVGYDDYRPMRAGETGGSAAAPIWLYFMKEALEGRPIRDFAVPPGVVFYKMVDVGGGDHEVLQAFKEGTEPRGGIQDVIVEPSSDMPEPRQED